MTIPPRNFRRRARSGWEAVSQDFRYAVRTLTKSPGFTLVAVLTLALGIGATTTIFSVVHGMILKSLPYGEAGQLVEVVEAPAPGEQNPVSPGVFLDWRAQTTLFEGLAAEESVSLNLTGAGDPVRLNGLKMSANGLRLLRAQPVRGRTFADDEDQAGKEKVVVITFELWQRQFGASNALIGQSVRLNGENFTVIGVLPKDFLPSAQREFVIPYVLGREWREDRSRHFLSVKGRLKSGVTVAQGAAEIAAIADRSKNLYPAWKKDWGTAVVPLDEQLVRNIKPALLVLLAAVGLLLLIACANVANLLLARAVSREKEIALRVALGATRPRIIAQLLIESLVLSLLGGALGLLLSVWSIHVLRQVIGGMNFARAQAVSLDAPVLLACLAIAVITGITFGVAPALQAARVQLTQALKDATRGSAARGSKVRDSLIVGEVALSLVLLVGAGLLLHSFIRILNVSSGVDPEKVLTLQLSLADASYPDNLRRLTFFNRIAERVAQLPGVTAAGLGRSTPFGGGSSDNFVRIPGWSGDREPGYDAIYEWCTADYFHALGVPLIAGRSFDMRDLAPGRRTAIINQTMARDCFAGENPIGRRLVYDQDAWEIVGVVGDVRYRGILRPPKAVSYRAQPPEAWRNATLFVRTTGKPLAIAEDVRKVIHEIDPNQPIANVRPLTTIIAESLGDRRLTATVILLFATAALLLAAVGLYGVIAHAVTQRTREFGIRFALGASKQDVVRLVLRRALSLTGAGLVCGLVGSLGVTRLLSHLLFEVKPTDPLTLAVVSLLLILVALIASWLPARRAAKVDPMVALRYE